MARVAALVMAIVGLLAAPPPAGADPDWHPPPGAVPDAPTYAYFASTQYDPVGGGRTFSYAMPANDILVETTGGRIDLRVEDIPNTWVPFWDATFQPPGPVEQVEVGRYEGLSIYEPEAPERGSLVVGNQACPDAEGWYEVDEAAYDAHGELETLALRFEFRCKGAPATSAFRGEVRWDATSFPPVPHPVWPVPGTMWSPPAGAVPAGTERYLYVETQPAAHAGAPLTYLYDTPAEVAPMSGFFRRSTEGETVLRLLHEDGVSRKWTLTLKEPRYAGWPAPGLSDDLPAVGADPIEGGFTASYRRDDRVCTDFTSDVAVDEIDSRAGTLSDVTLRFVQTCTAANRTSYRGEYRWQPDPPAGTAPSPTGVTATAGERAAEVAWTHAGTGVTGYVVTTYREGEAVATTEVAGDTRSVVVDDLRPGVGHTFKVAARNAAGLGLRSAASAAVVPTGDPEPGPSPAPFATFEDLVAQQYADFAGRPPTPSEQAADAAALRAGEVTPEAYVAALRLRPEWAGRRAVVIRLYSAYFLRRPDSAGLEYWAGELAAGKTVNQVSQAFAASQEFRTRYGSLSNREFVRRVYLNVLERQPDAAGWDYWTARLAGGTSRGAVMTGFSESAENKVRRQPLVDLVLVYQGMLRRVPDLAETEGWLPLLEHGATAVHVAGSILHGTEYAARVT